MFTKFISSFGVSPDSKLLQLPFYTQNVLDICLNSFPLRKM